MNERCPTVTIMTGNGPVIINESDYDPDVHTLESDAKPKRGKAAPEAPAAPPASGGDDTSGDDSAPVGGPLAPHASAMTDNGSAEDVKLVAKIGRNYFVVNDKGQKIEDDAFLPKGYGTEKEAWDAIMAAASNA